MVREYGRTINRSPDPRESEPVLYVYPDGVYTKTQKRQRIDRIFRGWDAVKSDAIFITTRMIKKTGLTR